MKLPEGHFDRGRSDLPEPAARGEVDPRGLRRRRPPPWRDDHHRKAGTRMTDFAAGPKLDAREEHFRIPGPREGLSLFLRFLPAADSRFRPRRSVLYVHGATFPSGLSIAHRFDGHSWRDALCEAGFDTWGFDFHGFGYSDRYPA